MDEKKIASRIAASGLAAKVEKVLGKKFWHNENQSNEYWLVFEYYGPPNIKWLQRMIWKTINQERIVDEIRSFEVKTGGLKLGMGTDVYLVVEIP